MEYNINGLTIAIIVVIFFAILFLVFYESWIRPKIIEYTGKHIDSNTDKDGTLTENKEKLGWLKLDDSEHSSETEENREDKSMPPMISQAIVEIEKKVEQPTKLTEIPEAANESDHESDSAIVRSKENLLSEIFEKHD